MWVIYTKVPLSGTQEHSMEFTVGAVVHVWTTKGCTDLSTGPSSSERTGGNYPDITPSEDLLVLKCFGKGSALCQRPNGQVIRVHHNHINEAAKYNTSKKRALPQSQDLEASIRLLEAQLALLRAKEETIEAEAVAEAKVA
jgi:hypothetical protein